MSHSLTLVCDKIGSRHQFGSGGGAFGRSRKCDWVLPDQERHLSSVHARIIFQNETFVLVDESTNGTFLEGHTTAIGRGKAVSLSPGMKLQAGPYEIRVESITAGPSGQTGAFAHSPITDNRQTQSGTAPLGVDTLGASVAQKPSLDPLDHLGGGSSQPLTPVAVADAQAATIPEPVSYAMPTQPGRSGTPTRMQPGQTASAGAPEAAADQTRIAPAPATPDASALLPTSPDDLSPATQVQPQSLPVSPVETESQTSAPNVVLPQAAQATPSQPAAPADNLIPEDFLSSLTGGAAAPPLPAAPSPLQETGQPAAATPVEAATAQAVSTPEETPGGGVIPDGVDFGMATPVDATPSPVPQPQQLAAAPAAPASQTPATTLSPLEALKRRRAQREAELAQKAKSRAAPGGDASTPTQAPGSSKAAATSAPSPVVPATAIKTTPPEGTDAEAAVFQALLAGLGFANASVAQDDKAGVARETGELVRELANGLIALLSARKSLKSEFRMYETRIQPEENNPFKHFNVGELAIDEMLFSRKGGFMEPAEAAKEAFKDLQSQNMITIAATQRAMRLLFESLSPETLAGEEDDGGLRLKGLGSRRSKFEAAKERHERLRADFDAIVRQTIAEAFVQIEEEQVRQQSKDFWGNRK